MHNKKYILQREAAEIKLQRLSLEIAEQLSGTPNQLIILGVEKSGVVIAQKIQHALQKIFNQTIPLISITLNKSNPTDIQYSQDQDFNNKQVIVCDDVANSGKTLLYAIKPLLNYQPASIKTLVLVERKHHLFPIQPDFVGLSIATTLQDHIVVEIEDDEILGAYIA